jgi:hypothetical protein
MVKRIIAVIAGLAVAIGIIMAFESAGGVLFKTPELDPRNPKTISDMMANMPLAAFIWLLLGHGIGALAGGLIATYIVGRNNVQPALIVGGCITVGGIMNLVAIPYHPLWFMITDTLIFLPLAWVGYLLAKKKNQETAPGK